MNKALYRLLVVLSILSLSLVSVSAPASAAPWQSKVDPWVLQTATAGSTEFLVYLTTQADLSAAKALPTKLEKGTYVYKTLTSTATRTQKGLIAQLQSLGVEYHPYWIANMVWVRGNLDTIQLLAQRLDVAHLYANPSVHLDAPVAQAGGNYPEGIEWNLSWVNAPQVWDLGFRGQGTVIGGQDTGYQWDHPAIINQYRGWDGNAADHNYNWIDATSQHSQTPIDPYGHGTHTMGTMVGDDGGNNKIGMAPAARWIGCRNMDAGGNGTPETYSACYQWFIAPTRLDGSDPRPDLAPDVINNSWGCPPSEGCTDPDVLLIPVQNLVAAGIVTAHSAGNSGSGCSTVSDPAAIYDESFTVGATGDHSDTIASFSSRGPVTVDGSNRPKPDISAPGVNVRSSVPNNGYASLSGTSMAGPHVAGLVALLISAQPAMHGQVDLIEDVIEQSALPRPASSPFCGDDQQGDVPNNVYGWGRIDALAAVQTNLHQLELQKTASALSVTPGDLITYTLTITHSVGISPTTNVVLTDTVPAGSTFVSATEPHSQDGDTIRWDFPSLEAMQTASVNLTVQAEITATDAITNADYFVRSDQAAPVQGEPVVTQVEAPELPVLALSKASSTDIVFPGGFITYTLTVFNMHESAMATDLVLTDTLPIGTSFVSATLPYTQDGGVVRWDFASLPPMGTVSVQLVVRVKVDAVGLITNELYAVYSDQTTPLYGTPVDTVLGSLYFLPVAQRSP